MGALQIALLASQIFGTLEPIVQPFAVAGINALVAVIKSHIASGKKMSFREVHDLAAEHGVDMSAVYRGAGLAGALTLAGGVMAVRALQKK